MKKKIDLQIDTDFSRDIDYAVQVLYPIFKANGWTWQNNIETPTRGELEKHIRHQVNTILDTGYDFTSSGRTTVRLEQDDADEYHINISLDIVDLYDDRLT